MGSSFWRSNLHHLWYHLDIWRTWVFLDWFSFWHCFHLRFFDLVYLIESIIKCIYYLLVCFLELWFRGKFVITPFFFNVRGRRWNLAAFHFYLRLNCVHSFRTFIGLSLIYFFVFLGLNIARFRFHFVVWLSHSQFQIVCNWFWCSRISVL